MFRKSSFSFGTAYIVDPVCNVSDTREVGGLLVKLVTGIKMTTIKG